MLTQKIFENRMLENAFPSTLGCQTLTLVGCIKLLLYSQNHYILKSNLVTGEALQRSMKTLLASSS